MKNKTNTDKASESLIITRPQDIIAAHLAPAIKPFAAELLAAAAIDREANAEMEAMHPVGVKKEADALFERAASGDKTAEKQLHEAGGKAEYIAKRTAHFEMARAKHEAACKASAPLWQKVSDSILAAIDAADAAIQKQFESVMVALGEPSGLSNWNAYCRNLKNGIRSAPNAAENLRHGADWQLRALGLAELVGLDG
jgi:hypothetical protein